MNLKRTVLVALVLALALWVGYILEQSERRIQFLETIVSEQTLLIKDQVHREESLSNQVSGYKEEVAKLQKVNDNLNKELKKHGVAVSRGDFSRHKIVDCKITAYSPYDNVDGNQATAACVTSTGTKPSPGTIAVDPKVIPYGSTIYIVYDDGRIETGTAEDCGGAVKGNHIDVFRVTYSQAIKFGVQHATVYWQ